MRTTTAVARSWAAWIKLGPSPYSSFAAYCDCLRIYHADGLLGDGSAFARGYWLSAIGKS